MLSFYFFPPIFNVIGWSLVSLMLCFSSFQDCGWKGWGEISYGGYKSVKRARAAEVLVYKLKSSDCASAIAFHNM